MLKPKWLSLAGLQFGWVPLAIALAGLLSSQLPFSAQLEEEAGLGLLYALRGPSAPSDRVVIVGIDHESALRLQAPDEPHAWSRRLHADILRNAQRGKAELVAFNIFFSDPSPVPQDDQSMAEAMRGMGNVVLTDYVKPRQLQSGMYIESIVEPAAELADAALATAPFLLPKHSIGANEFLTFFGDEEKRATLPTLLLTAYTLRTRCAELAAWLGSADPGLATFLESDSPCQSVPWDFGLVGRKLSNHFLARPSLGAVLSDRLADSQFPEATQRLLGSLWRVLSGRETRFFNHYGPARSFRTIPYYRLAGAASEETLAALAGKVLVVGYLEDFQPETAEGLFYTPYSTVSSVELAATAIANLLEDRWVHPLFSPLNQALWLLAWGGVLGLLAIRLSARRGSILIAALGGAYFTAAWLLFSLRGDWLPLAPALGAQLPSALLACFWLNYLRRARREQTMQSVIHRFIPVDVFSHLTRHEDVGSLPTYGRLTRGACLATDAGRYTALAETMEPMALARLMNAYYEAIFEPVARHGGWISDVVGDAMLAIWLADDGDDPKACRNALAAAMEIRQAVRRFERLHELVFPIRMGIHHGDLRIGYVGTAERGEIRAVGDTVNTAARLEALNKLLGTQILAEQGALEGLAMERVRPLGEFLLAGKSKPISVVELAPDHGGPQPDADPLRARFGEALELFSQERWLEAHAAFTLLSLQFPDDGPTRFYHKTCQAYLAEPGAGRIKPGIAVEKPAPAQLFNNIE
jgi:adenylate cyclase